MPWGHRSIAKAIYGYLKDKKEFKTDYVEVKAELMGGGDAYTFVYRFVPSLNRVPHRLSENRRLLKLFNKKLDKVNEKSLLRVVKKYRPDLIICSYAIHSHALAEIREKYNFDYQLWTVAADPRTINAYSFVAKADLNLVYDRVVYNLGIKHGLEPNKLFMTGWWTRREMFEKRNRKKEREKLGIKDDRPVVFVGGGSLGTNSLTRLLPVLLLVKKPITVVINTGTDKLAYKLVESYKKLVIALKNGAEIEIKNMGWVEDMAGVLTASDIVFGKAGPNFLFEVMAVGRPFVAITHIGGQEDGNIELIEEKKLGWVKEKAGQAGKFLLAYVKNPRKYENKYKKNIQKEALKNKKSLELIYKKIISC